MPYPIVHMLFFIFGVTAVAVYATVRSIFHKGTTFGSSMSLMLLFLVGSLCSLFPDITIIYNLLVNGTTDHCWIGTFPTHSLLFSFLAILFGTITGYTAYREFGKAIYLGLFGEAAFFSHLLLDDACGASCTYFYPIYNKPISLFSVMNIGFEQAGLLHYLIISFVSVSFVFFFIAIALFSLNQFGFEFKYRSQE
jgi:hypothetical protein